LKLGAYKKKARSLKQVKKQGVNMTDIMRLERAKDLVQNLLDTRKINDISLKQVVSDVKFVLDNLKEETRS